MDDDYFHEPFGPIEVRPAPEDCPNCQCCTARLCQQAAKVTGFTQPDLASAQGIPCEYVASHQDRELVRGCPCTAGLPAKPQTREVEV